MKRSDLFRWILPGVLLLGGLAAQAAGLREAVEAATSTVYSPEGGRLPATVVLERRWEGALCRATLRNSGTETVRVGNIVQAEWRHGLATNTPVYGEGFTMLSQIGGTLGAPVDEGFYTDRSHYRLAEPGGRRTAYGVLTLRPSANTSAVLGFTSARRFVGRFSFDAETLVVSQDGEGLALAAGQSWELEPLLVNEGPDRSDLLESLAAQLTVSHPPIHRRPVASGWCSWYCFGPKVTADQIRGNLAWARQKFPGLRYIQIDDGYQPWMGDWLETGKSFGGDIRSVLKEIQTQGFEPALWLAPFVASPESRLFREHPDWFVKDTDGKPLRSDKVGFGGWRLAPWYVIDGTHPGAQRWLEDLFRTMREQWGVTYFKLDATYWGALHGGVHHDPKATRVEAFRRGMEAMRRGAGDAFILGCNHPMWPSLGLIHGSRASMDITRNWEHISRTGRENLLRGWQNGRLWWNDPDAVCLNGKILADAVPDAPDLPVTRSIGQASEDEFLFHATLIYATGGMLLTGDDMRTYGEKELARLNVLYPPTGTAMRFDSEQFSVGRLTIPGGERIALLNWDQEARAFSVPVRGRVRVKELWSGTDLGSFTDRIVVPQVPGHAGRLLHVVADLPSD